jgi:hypothetical protein
MLQPFLCQKHKQYIKNVWLKLYEESAVLILNCSFNIFIQLTLNLPMVLEKSAGTKRLSFHKFDICKAGSAVL